MFFSPRSMPGKSHKWNVCVLKVLKIIWRTRKKAKATLTQKGAEAANSTNASMAAEPKATCPLSLWLSGIGSYKLGMFTYKDVIARPLIHGNCLCMCSKLSTQVTGIS